MPTMKTLTTVAAATTMMTSKITIAITTKRS
jgi:hypothetical protein